jgi:transposase
VQYTLGMNANPYPTDLTDAEWDLIKDLIPPPKPGGRHRALDMRAVVNAILYVVDGGMKCRLRKDYERLPKSSEAMIYLSMPRLMLRRLTAT